MTKQKLLLILLIAAIGSAVFAFNSLLPAHTPVHAEAENTSGPASAQVPAPAADEAEIRALLARYYEIASRNERAALREFSRQLTAPEYRHSSEAGTLDKAAAFRRFDAEPFEFVAPAFDSLTVTVYGDTAVAKYRDFSTVRIDGAIRRTPLTYTNFWVKRDGRWLIAAEHSSVLAEPGLPAR